MVEATLPLGKDKDSVWYKLPPPLENIRILHGRSYSPLRKTTGSCMVEATPPLGKPEDSAR